jgi:hypothetical protein
MDIDSHEVEALVFFFDEDDSGDLNFGELVTIVRYLFKARRAGLLTAFDLPADAVEKERARQHSLGSSDGLRNLEIHGREYVFGPSFDDEERAPTPSPTGARGTLGGLVAPGAATFSFLPTNKVAPLPHGTAAAAADTADEPLPLKSNDEQKGKPSAPGAGTVLTQGGLGEPSAQSSSAHHSKKPATGVAAAAAAASKPDPKQPAELSATDLETRSQALQDEAAGLRAMIAEARNMQKWAKEKRHSSGSGHEHRPSDDESLLHVVADFGHSLGHLAAIGATSIAGSFVHAAHTHMHLPGHHHDFHGNPPSSPTTHHNQDSPKKYNEKHQSSKKNTNNSNEPKENTSANQLAPKNSFSVPPQLEPLKQSPLPLPKEELKEVVPANNKTPAPGVSFPRRAAFSSEQSSAATQKGATPTKTKGFPLQKKNPSNSKVFPLESFSQSEMENLARGISDASEGTSIDAASIDFEAFIVPAGIDSAVL